MSTSITSINKRWVVSETETDKFVRQYNEILNSPACGITTQDVEKVTYYSEEQMMKMFRLGYRCKAMGPYKILGKMAVGTTQVFPSESLFSVRNAASRLKKNYNKLFSIKRRMDKGKEVDIIVTRSK